MNQEKIETITINNVEYIRKENALNWPPEIDGMPFVIVRADRTGVFNGYLKERNGSEVVLLKARRMWKWIGASLSQCAQSGTPEPSNNKWPEAVDKVEILDAIEILHVTKKAKDTFDKVPVWKR